MMYFLEQTDHWDSTEKELAAIGVIQVFYNIYSLSLFALIYMS